MPDRISISNLALAKLGNATPITDPNEDTQAARSIAAVWDLSRRTTLRKGKFNFSVRRFELTAQASTDPFYQSPHPFTNRFPLPAGCLRFVELVDPCTLTQYKIEGGALLANSDGPLWIRCVVDVPDPGTWDDLFAAAMAARLAFETAEVITGDRARKSDCYADFRKAISDAAGTDAKEDPPEEPYESSWVTARCAGPLGGPPNVWRP